MTQEEKDLVFLELSSRMKYGIKCSYPYGVGKLESITIDGDDIELTFESPDNNYYPLDDRIKPYLRPLSDMTKEEKEEFERKTKFKYYPGHVMYDYIPAFDNNCTEFDTGPDPDYSYSRIKPEDIVDCIDWLCSHYFDYRGLIPRNLALKALDGIYKKCCLN